MDCVEEGRGGEGEGEGEGEGGKLHYKKFVIVGCGVPFVFFPGCFGIFFISSTKKNTLFLGGEGKGVVRNIWKCPRDCTQTSFFFILQENLKDENVQTHTYLLKKDRVFCLCAQSRENKKVKKCVKLKYGCCG